MPPSDTARWTPPDDAVLVDEWTPPEDAAEVVPVDESTVILPDGRYKRAGANDWEDVDVSRYKKAAEILSRTPALGVGELAYASQIPAEDRALFRDVLERQYAADQTIKKAGYGQRLATSAVQGAIDFGLPFAKYVPGSPIPRLDPDQERYRQELARVRETQDPVIRPGPEFSDDPLGWAGGELGGAAQQAARMAFPMIQSQAAGAIGKRVAGRPGQAMGVAASFLPQIADQTYSSLIGEGVDPDTAWKITAVSAPIEAGMEAILPDFLSGYGAAFKGTVRQVASRILTKATVNYTKELSEEGLQGIVNETALEVGRRLDDEIPDKGLGNILSRGVSEMQEAALPLLLLGAPGGAVSTVQNIRASAVRPGRLAALKAIRAKGPVSRKDGRELGIDGNQEERTAKVDEQIRTLEQEIQNASQVQQDETSVAGQRDAGTGVQEPGRGEVRGGREIQGGPEQAGEVAPAPEVQVKSEAAPTQDEISAAVAEEMRRRRQPQPTPSRTPRDAIRLSIQEAQARGTTFENWSRGTAEGRRARSQYKNLQEAWDWVARQATTAPIILTDPATGEEVPIGGPGTHQEAPATPQATTFTTSKGSTYEFADGRTTRTKSKHEFHDPKDVGKKQQSDSTVFVDPEFANEIGMWNTSSAEGKRIVVGRDGKVILTSINPKTGQRGKDGEGAFTTNPEVGRSPVELWGQKGGMWKGNHPGNEITTIGEAAPQATRTPQEAVSQPSAPEAAPAAPTPQEAANAEDRANAPKGPFFVEWGTRSHGNDGEEFSTYEEAIRTYKKRAKSKRIDFVSIYDGEGNEIDVPQAAAPQPTTPQKGVEEAVPAEVPTVDKWGRPVPKETVAARKEFLEKAQTGVTFTHSGYPKQEFKVDEGRIIETTSGRHLGSNVAKFAEFIEPGQVTWTTPKSESPPQSATPPQKGQQAIPAPRTPDEANQLPAGQVFLRPDGTLARRESDVLIDPDDWERRRQPQKKQGRTPLHPAAPSSGRSASESIVNALREDPDFLDGAPVSPGELAERLGVPVADLAPAILKLRDEGKVRLAHIDLAPSSVPQEQQQKTFWNPTANDGQGAYVSYFSVRDADAFRRAESADAEPVVYSGVVHPSLDSEYATDNPNMAAHHAEQPQAINAPNPAQTGEGVVRVYRRSDVRGTELPDEFKVKKGAIPIEVITSAEARQRARRGGKSEAADKPEAKTAEPKPAPKSRGRKAKPAPELPVAAQPEKTPESDHERSVAYFNIMQLFSTGRLDSETETAIMGRLGVDTLGDAYRKLKEKDPQTLADVQKIIGPREASGRKESSPEPEKKEPAKPPAKRRGRKDQGKAKKPSVPEGKLRAEGALISDPDKAYSQHVFEVGQLLDRQTWHRDPKATSTKPMTLGQMNKAMKEGSKFGFGKLVKERGWYTDGHMLVDVSGEDMAALLKGVSTEGHSPRIDDFLKMPPRLGDNSEVLAYKDPQYFGVQEVALSGDHGPVVVDRRLFETVQRYHKNVKWYATGEDSPVKAVADGKVVGVVMPMRQENGIDLSRTTDTARPDLPLEKGPGYTVEFGGQRTENGKKIMDIRLFKGEVDRSIGAKNVPADMVLRAEKRGDEWTLYDFPLSSGEVGKFGAKKEAQSRIAGPFGNLRQLKAAVSDLSQYITAKDKYSRPTFTEAAKPEAPKKRSQQAAERKEAAKERFLEAGRRLIDPTKPSAGLDPAKVMAAVDMAFAAMDYGVASFDQFVSLAVESFNEQWVRDRAAYLEEAARQSGIEGVTSIADVLDKPPEPPKSKGPPPLPGKQPSDDPVTSIKNEIVNELRERRGLPELPGAEAQSQQEWLDRAEAILADDPGRGDRIVKEINKNPRNLSNTEVAVMQIHYRRLNNQLEESSERLFDAHDRGDSVEAAIAQADVDNVMTALAEMEDATKAAGREWGRAGVARQITLARDFSLAGMMRRARVANAGAPLSAEQQAEIAAMAKTIEELEGKLSRLEQEKSDRERERRVDEGIAEDKKKAKRTGRKSAARKKVDAAWAEFEALAKGKLYSNPIELAVPAAKIVSAYVELGVVSFAEFMANVSQRIGADATIKAHDVFKAAWDDAKAKGDIPTPEIDRDDLAGITRLARRIQRALVESGITKRDDVVDAVHESLQEVMPGITRRETMDALSGYGQFTPLSKDEIDRTIRDINGQLQQLAKLEDMEAGKAPSKTGPERRTPSDEERRLIQQVNEAKKRGGFNVTDPEQQLKTALDAAKTATRNRIADLEHEIRTKERIVRERRELTPDAELEALRKQRDELRKVHEELFPPPQKKLTDAQRIANAVKAADRAIKLLEQQLATRNFDRKRPPPLSSPELDAKRARLAQLRAAREAAKAFEEGQWEGEGGAIRGKKLLSAEEKSRRAYEASLRKRIADYQQRIANREFDPRPKKEPRKLDPQELKLKKQLEDVKHEFFEKAAEYRLANMSPGERAWDYAKETAHLSRAAMTSIDLSAVFRQGGPAVFAHPALAAKAGKEMLKALASRQAEFNSMEEIRHRPNGQLYETARLSITEDEGKLTRQEEAYMGRWAKKVPGIAASARAYTTFLNNIRADLFDAMVENLGRGGQVTLDEAKVIARYVNVATGRADLGKYNQAAANLNMVFFAPRYVASRFQYLAMPFYLPFTKTSGRVKRLIAAEYARHAVGVTTFLGLAVALASLLTDDDDEKPTVELDPRSSDFLKLRIGETRIDPMSGLSQAVVVSSRVLGGKTKTAGGEVKPIRGPDVPYGQQTTASVLGNFLRTKLAPVPGAAVDVLAGETVVGEDVTPVSAAAKMFIPLALREVKETMEARGIPAGTAISILGLLGMGLGTYGPKTRYMAATPEERIEQFNTDLKNMQWDSPDPAYSEFLNDEQLEQVRQRREERKQSVVTAAVVDAQTDTSKEELEAAKQTLRDTGWSHLEAQQHLLDHYKGDKSGNEYWDKFKALAELYGLDKDAARNELLGPTAGGIRTGDTDFKRWESEQRSRWLEERKKEKK